MSEDEVLFASALRQAELVRTGAISARELTDLALARITALDANLNAFRVVMAETARAEADAVDAALAAGGVPGPLAGVPVAVKDEIEVAGQLTGFGGAAQTTPAKSDAEIVRRLRGAGAVIIGKTTMSEFGQWPFTESQAHGHTRNPWNPAHTPGGSSGGSAVAVASGMVAVAIGGDGGGSIRIPAACCGLFGLKPQRGRVPAHPLPQLWNALGTAGALTRTVADSAIVYDIISGSVDTDRWRADTAAMPFARAAVTAPPRLRIGYCATPALRGVRVHPEHVTAVTDTAAALRDLGHEVRKVRPGYPDATAAFVPQFYGAVRTEAAMVDLPERLERRTRQTVGLSRLTPDAVVEWAIRRGEKVAAKANRVFDGVDLLLTPTIAQRPRPVGVLDGKGSIRAQLVSLPMIAFTALWNVTGNPAASIPAGFGTDGLPIGVQLVAAHNDEATIMQVAAQLEQVRPWSGHRPQF